MTKMSIDEFYKLCDESFTEKEKQDIKKIQDILKEDIIFNAILGDSEDDEFVRKENK